ncbi:hypothetical protein ZWY2020_049951 [Hordeum vulgare]|nr:hypothetical protein ZWY2020_049951 [Hordeum vulgare]
MALSSGILALSIIGVLVAGIVTVVATIAIYLCAKVAVQMYLHKEDKLAVTDAWLRTSSRRSTPRAARTQADDAEMGSMSFFIEGARNSARRFSSQLGFTQASRQGQLRGFGAVVHGQVRRTPVAVKVLNNTLGRRAEEQFMAEVGTIGRTYHINLVRLYAFCFDAAVKALVYEYMVNGSLDRHLFGTRAPDGRVIEFDKLHEIAVGTAKAVRYLHEECQHRIIHYDIKPDKRAARGRHGAQAVRLRARQAVRQEDTHLTIIGAGTPARCTELWMSLPVTQKCDGTATDVVVRDARREELELGLHSRESQEW